MAKNIDFMGATFPDVPSIRLPQHEGGLVSFTDVTDTTAEASDVASGKYFYTADGTKTAGTASGGITPSGTIQISQNGQVDVTQYATADVNVSGGGGASNIVTGSFKFDGTTTRAENITLDYNGNGYPIFVAIKVKGGLNGNADYSALVRRYAYCIYVFQKSYESTTPTWTGSGDDNLATSLYFFKNSTSNATTYSQAGTNFLRPYNNADASQSSSHSYIVRLKDSKTLSVFITGSGTQSYGFPSGIEYDYVVIYSS